MMPSLKFMTSPRLLCRRSLPCWCSFLPAEKIADIQALTRIAFGNAQEQELIQRTLDAISTKARDQDIIYYFAGLAGNFKTRRLLVDYFRDHYTEVWINGNFLAT